MNKVVFTKQQAQDLLSGDKSTQTKRNMESKEIARLWVEHSEMLVRIHRMEEKLDILAERIEKIGVDNPIT